MPAVEIEASVPKCDVDVEDESSDFICTYSALYLPAVGDVLMATPGWRNSPMPRGETGAYEVVRREWDLDEDPVALRLIVKRIDLPPRPVPDTPF